MAVAPINNSSPPPPPAHLKRVVQLPVRGRKASYRSARGVDSRALRARRLRIISYFVRLSIHFIWWDYILKQPGLRVFRTPWVPRWHRLTERYKRLALELQGMWVKLGQYLSTRVDVLPLEITRELESLRDEVPAEPTKVIINEVEADFNRPFGELFEWLSPWPIGSASLAQVHRARTVGGESVVVKVLRPGIHEVIRADIRLLRQLAHWLKWIRPIARRANIDAIVNEFDVVTNNELNLRLEAQNVERFAEDFAADTGVSVPRIYHSQSSINTLTMEDVSFIRIDNLVELDKVGIDRKAVASKVYNIYLQQFFITYRVHADPHPGNLFIRPLPTAAELATYPSGFRPGDNVPYALDRPFQLVIVDFGMFVELPQRMREGFREFAIGVGTRDSRRILDAYTKVGVLRSGADLERLEEMVQVQLDEFWGSFLGQVRASDLASPAAKAFFEKYEDLVSSTPLQFQTEMLFIVRAMGILSGVTTHLDPDFDPWKETASFAQRLIQEDILKAVRSTVQDLVSGRLPSTLGSLLTTFSRPQPAARQSPLVNSLQTEEILRLRRRVNRLTSAVAASAVLAVGIVLKSKGVRVSEFTALLWAGNDLGQWLIEIAGIALVVTLLIRGSNR